MENEIRYYLKSIKQAMANEEKAFKPSYLVTACRLPTGAIELAVNTSNISEKIDYILEAYDEEMCLKNNSEIRIENILIV